MSIYTTYAELITEQIIKEILAEGATPSASEITQRFEEFVESNDITKPLFTPKNYHVSYGSNSSVSEYNQSNNDIYRDLKVLYRHMFKVSDQSINQFNRWRNEAKLLEGRLNDLVERVDTLLLVSSDTAGYLNFMQDNFVDNSKIDLANSSVYSNPQKGTVSLATSNTGATRIDLSSLTNSDIEFTVLSRSNLVSSVSSNGSELKYAISDATSFWQERVYTNSPKPVTSELKITFPSDTTISRIDVDLHMSNQNSTVQLTPMYSLDNYTWKQLAVTNYTRSIVDKTIFQFAPVSARYVKFIMTKSGFDQIHSELYAYEFGVDEISFYNEGFTANTEAVLMSKTLSVNDIDGNIEEFSRIVLEVCEDIPEDTSIDYSVAVSNTTPVPTSSFTGIDPLNRENTTKPTILDFGDLDAVTVSGIKVSYSPGANLEFINPAQDYTFISSISGTTAIEQSASTTTTSGTRYSFFNSNDRVLDHQVSSSINMAQGTLEVWRNVLNKNDETLIRDYVNGWGFEDPYYKTTVYVSNASGFSVDFGSKIAVVNGEARVGKVFFTAGRHSIWIHKDNWKYVSTSGVTNLATLKAADSLYPYNHRYLVEGFSYPSTWSTTEEKVYYGFDIVAEYFMKQVSTFDMINNVLSTDYEKFALDLDVADTGRTFSGAPASDQAPSNVFLVKVDESNPNFINEEFLVKFKSANSLFKYLRLKAVMKTTITSKTPFIDSYRIKISS